MALDKLVDSSQLDADLTSVANAIRTKGGTTAALAFPADFVSAIGDIPTGGGGTSGLASGTFTLAERATSVSFDVPFNPAVVLVYCDEALPSDSTQYRLGLGFNYSHFNMRYIRQSSWNANPGFNKSYNSETGKLTVSRPSGSWVFEAEVQYTWIIKETI